MTIISPSKLKRIQQARETAAEKDLEAAALSTAERILEEAARSGLDGVYLYNGTFTKDSEYWPIKLVQRAVDLLNESGMWQAKAERVHFWHLFIFRNLNWRRHAGTPVWRIRLARKGGNDYDYDLEAPEVRAGTY